MQQSECSRSERNSRFGDKKLLIKVKKKKIVSNDKMAVNCPFVVQECVCVGASMFKQKNAKHCVCKVVSKMTTNHHQRQYSNWWRRLVVSSKSCGVSVATWRRQWGRRENAIKRNYRQTRPGDKHKKQLSGRWQSNLKQVTWIGQSTRKMCLRTWTQMHGRHWPMINDRWSFRSGAKKKSSSQLNGGFL